MIGAAAGFAAALVWFRVFATHHAAADPVDNWARGITQLMEAVASAGMGAVIGGVIAAVLSNRSSPDAGPK